MPDFCTCGAQLPPDARFCHKCGKPQREEPVVVEEVHEPEPLIAAPPVEVEPERETVSLSNRYAVRAALIAGVAAFVLAMPFGGLVFIFALPGAGFSVFLYGRSTGRSLSVTNGAKLGWITGVFLFVIVLIFFTLIYSQPTFFAEFEDQLRNRMQMPPAEAREAIRVLQSPIGIAVVVFFFFVMSTLPATIGGAIGAKLLRRG